MKVIEILKLNRGVLEACRDIGIRLEDVKYIDLYCDYNRLRANGEKVSYIVAVLAEKYGVCVSARYMRLSRDSGRTATWVQCNHPGFPLDKHG